MAHHRTTTFTVLAVAAGMFGGARPVQARNNPVTIVVHVADHARLTPADRGGMEREAARIFSAAGVHLEWRDGFDRWNEDDGRFHVAIVLLNTNMGQRQMTADRLEPNALGEAVRPARRAYVFHDRVAGLLFKDATKVNHLGQAIQMRTMSFGGRAVTVTAVLRDDGSGGSYAEIFFLDPATGKLLDGQQLDSTHAQPHLSVPIPFPVSKSTAIGDVNGDGIPDLAVGDGAVASGTTGVRSGNAVVLLGTMTSGVLGYTPINLTPPAGDYNGLGSGLAFGDLDGDGRDEVVVGAMGTGTGKGILGKVFVFKFNGSGFTWLQTLVDPGGKGDDKFGVDVAIGDVTGTHALDLVVGAPFSDINGLTDSGAVYVYPGPLPLLNAPSYTLTGGVNKEGLAHNVFIGDVIGGATGPDGLGDVIAGTGPAGGRAAIFGGLVGSNRVAADFSLLPADGLDGGWGTTSIKVVDLNGDGRDDVFIGAPNTAGCRSGAVGAAYVFLADPNGGQPARYMLQAPALDVDPAQYGQSMGVAPGSPLVLVGEISRNLGTVTSAGQVYVYRLLP